MTSHICVVMAVYNRLNNVHMALHSWSLQTRKDFSIVVADDGSSDDIAGLVEKYGGMNIQHYRRRYGNVAVMLNKGTALVPEETTHVWYTDGDIVRDKGAMEWAYEHIEEHPEHIIMGRYDWLPAGELSEHILEHDFQSIGRRGEVRPDHRVGTGRYGASFFDHKLFDDNPLLGGNFIMPLDAWFEIGGWDEHIPGCNANDCDLSWCLNGAGYHSMTCDHIGGYHQWHPSDGKAKKEGACVSLVYIFRKHGKPLPPLYQPYIEKEREWREEHGYA
ncbi:MAG TPA: glycosyltransferase [Anaerolineae bacterium]|nr:glycosyltransferase [Anaerolineae bacterium]